MQPSAYSNNTTLRAPILWALIPWMIGCWIAERYPPINPVVLLSISFSGSVFSFVFPALRLWAPVFLGSVLCLGILYFQALENSHQAEEPWLSMPVRELELSLEVIRLFERRDDPYGRIGGIAEIEKAPAVRQDLLGKRAYFSLRAPSENERIENGSLLKAAGLLTVLHESNDLGFNRFLVQEGVAYEFCRGTIFEATKGNDGYASFCRTWNAKLESFLRLGSEAKNQAADVGVAMLLGNKAVLEQKEKQRYVAAGVMHLFAISGLHVGVVAAATAFLLRGLPGPKWLEALLCLGILFLYVEVTGGTPSATRAFMMVAFWWAARLLGRPGFSLPAIAAAACLTLLLQPQQLWNPGFQLSYSVVLAIILYGIPLAARLQAMWEPWHYLPAGEHSWRQRFVIACWKWFAGSLGVSFAATVASAPLVLIHFGVFTPGAILLNVFLVLIACVAIVSGFASMLGGLISCSFICPIFNHAQWILIWIMDSLVELFLKIPGLFFKLDVGVPFLAYLTLVVTLALVLGLARKMTMGSAWICLLPPLPLTLLVVFATDSQPL